MGLRDILKKKDELQENTQYQEYQQQYQQQHQQPYRSQQRDNNLGPPGFVFVRSDTATHEVIQPPGYQDQHQYQHQNQNHYHQPHHQHQDHLAAKEPSKARRSLDVFRPRSRSRSASLSSQVSASSVTSPRRDNAGRRLSHRLHLSREPESSDYVPGNLPEIVAPADPEDKEAAESQWEKRATILASQNELARSRPATPGSTGGLSQPRPDQRSRSASESRAISSQAIDADIQEAIRLHEAGDLQRSTRMFGRLADPNGADNPLSQVLYGLALRHGWGCEPDQAGAVKYLTAAASNAASVEQLALQAGLKKGGAAKGELVLAIFELGNCFRHGWGIEKDAFAAKQYYETAANLGDTDAMNEVAWCYLEGYGCKKDKFAAARYYRQAEKAGHKTLGNSWIWKDKYNPPGETSGKAR